MNPLIEESERWTEFIDFSSTGAERSVLLLMEHEEVYDAEFLVSLYPWNPEDRNQMERFRHDGARTSWCLARLLARGAMASLLGLDAVQLSFFPGERGKPYLPGNPAYFNWSHCPGCVALALSRSSEIGCDIENMNRATFDFREIAGHYFNQEESAWIGLTERDETLRRRFFSIFTQKEARLKACGHGLSASLAEAASCLSEPPFVVDGMVSLSFGRSGSFIASLYQEGDSRPTPIIRHFRVKSPLETFKKLRNHA